MVDYSQTHSTRLRSVTLPGEISNIITGLRAQAGKSTVISTGGGGGGGGVTGSGTVNTLSRWLTTTSLGDSHFIDDGTATDLSYGNNVYSDLFITGYGYTGGVQYHSELIARSARGVQGAFTALYAGDYLGVVAFRGCDYSNHFTGGDDAKINVTATPSGATWTASDHGCSIGFWTTAPSSITAHLRAAISGQGRFGLYSGDSDYYANFFASPTGMTGSVFYTLPSSYPSVSGYVLSCTTSGVMSWIASGGGAPAHPLLGATWHTDVDANTPTFGALIVSNATPHWTKFPNSGVPWQLLVTTSTGVGVAWLSQGASGSLFMTGGGSPPVLSWLGPGTAGYVLTMSGGYPSWQPGGGDTSGTRIVGTLQLYLNSTDTIACDSAGSMRFKSANSNFEFKDSSGNNFWEFSSSEAQYDGIFRPYTSTHGALGKSDRKWGDIWVVNTHFGDLGLSDKTCPGCGKAFQVGDDLVFHVKKVTSKEIITVPKHHKCPDR